MHHAMAMLALSAACAAPPGEPALPAAPPATAPPHSTPPGAPGAPPSTPAPPAPPAPPAAPAAPEVIALDVKGLVPQLDRMHDVRPAQATLGRCRASVVRVVPVADTPLTWLTWRVEPDSVALVARSEREQEGVLGRLRWRGAAIEWHWARVSATSFANAIAEAERMLPWMTLQITEEGGAQVVMQAPPLRVARGIRMHAPLAVAVPGMAGRTVALTAETAAAWVVEQNDPAVLRLVCSVGTLEVRVDAPGRLRAQVEPRGGILAPDLRRQIAEKQQEITRASKDERPFIEAEIAELRTRLAEAERQERLANSAWPAVPTIRARDTGGRAFAILDLKVESP